MLLLGNNAAAGSPVKASTIAPVISAMTESLWRIMARVAATCWMERVPFAANPADAPSTGSQEKSPKKCPWVENRNRNGLFFLGAGILSGGQKISPP